MKKNIISKQVAKSKIASKKILVVVLMLIFVVSLVLLTSCAPKKEGNACKSCPICGGCIELKCKEGKNCKHDFVCLGHKDKDGFVVRGKAILSYVGTASEISIPDGIEAIEKGAFNNNSNLVSVDIPDSVTYIGEDAFEDCPNLEYNVFDNQEYISNVLMCIINPHEVTSINLKPTISAMRGDPLDACDNLTAITVDDTNTRYRSSGGILFSKDETTIVRCPRALIQGRYSIPKKVRTIGSSAFMDCKGLTQISIHNQVVEIGESAFDACMQLASLVIPGSVEVIGKYAFVNCHQLKSITVQYGTKVIDDLAFHGNGQLLSITIPASVDFIGVYPFAFCHKDCQLYFGGSEERWDSINTTDPFHRGPAPTMHYKENK